METPYLIEFVRRLRLDDPTATLDVAANGAATLVWQRSGLQHPLVLLAREAELAAAVTAHGEQCRDALWPNSSIAEAGFNILGVHLDEVVATRDTTDPLRITAEGLEWPETLRDDVR